MTYLKDELINFPELEAKSISNPDGRIMMETGIGDAIIQIIVDGKRKSIQLKSVLYVPDLKRNSISTSAASDKEVKLIFDGLQVKIYLNGKLVAEGRKFGQLYYLIEGEDESQSNQASVISVNSTGLKEDIWHARF